MTEPEVKRIAAELALYGEVFLRTFVDATTGECVMRNLDPVLVEDIRIDPEDPEMATAYLYRPLTVTGAPTKAQWIDAATVDHWTVNAVGGSPRGRSDLAVVLHLVGRVVAPEIGPVAAMAQLQNNDFQNAQTIYTQIQADNQKQQMERWKIAQDTQTKIFEIQQDVTANKAQTQDKAFKKWAETNNERAGSSRRFGQLMTERGFERYKSNTIFYQGLVLNEGSDF